MADVISGNVVRVAGVPQSAAAADAQVLHFQQQLLEGSDGPLLNACKLLLTGPAQQAAV